MNNYKTLLIITILCSILPTLLSAQVDTAWARRYNGTSNSSDVARAIVIDNSGNVYVTGSCYTDGTDNDYLTIKYNRNGDTVWTRKYNGPGNSIDNAYSIAVDGSGNIYVTGESRSGPVYYDYATIKYNSSGDTVWSRRYNGPGNGTDCAYALTIDNIGNVYVTGRSDGGSSSYDYFTIKYNSSGVKQWDARFSSSGGYFDKATAIAVDAVGNVYITGDYKQGDCRTVKYNSAGDTVWTRNYDGGDGFYDYGEAVKVDGSGNIYITGASQSNVTSWDYFTIKYNSGGDASWVRRYNGPGNFIDIPQDMVIDLSGNVYVTGAGHNVTGIDDYITIKYNSNGDTLWVRTYNGPGNYYDGAEAITIDKWNNIYVTGKSCSNSSLSSGDYATIKYDANGDTMWIRRFNGPGNGEDRAWAIAVDSSGSVYITGGSDGSGGNQDYATIKYVIPDVGITSIIQPIGTIDSSASIIPKAKIKNFGGQNATCNITFSIFGSTSWSNTQAISNLAPNDTTTISFGSWTVGPRGNYTTRCSTYLSNDMVKANDTLGGTFTVRVKNYGADSITNINSPIDSGLTITPKAFIHNYGSQTETSIPVTFYISGTSYTSTKPVSLAPYTSIEQSFDSYTLNIPRDSYTMRCTTKLDGDLVTNNNLATRTLVVKVPDVGTSRILYPDTNVIDSVYTITPRARLKNYGTELTGFSVKYSIENDNWSNIQDIDPLASGDSIDKSFAEWTVRRGTYTAKCSTRYASDIVRSNDKLTYTFTVKVRDYKASSISAPFSPVDSGTKPIPKVWICNYGTHTELNVPVVLYIVGTPYTSTKLVTLNAGDSIEQSFDSLLPTIPRGSYTMRCTTQLNGDMIVNNNFAIRQLTIQVHDYAATAITSPPSFVDSSVTITPKAWVHNKSSVNKSDIPVTFYIDSTSYISTKLVTLNAGDSIEQPFDDFVTDIPRGNYTMRCSTKLDGDLVESNNKVTSYFTNIAHNVGVIDISQPDGNIDSCASIIPIAKVTNLGSRNETLDVIFTISGSRWMSIKPVIDLAPQEERYVEFDTWTVGPRGEYTTRCSTGLGTDLIHNNDVLGTTFTIQVFDFAATRFTSPVEPVDSGDIVIPKVMIHNYGVQREENVPVFLSIVEWPSYSSIRLISLNASDSTNDSFNVIPTADMPRGIYHLRCSTALSHDIVPYNNVATGLLIIQVPGWSQIEPILDPPEGNIIKEGGALVGVPSSGKEPAKLYAFLGTKTNRFRKYTVGSGWSESTSDSLIFGHKYKPATYEIDTVKFNKKFPGKGAALCYDGINTIYATKGNGTNEFFAYDISSGTWAAKAFVRAPKGLKGGTSIRWYNGKVYLLAGGQKKDVSVNNFWVYDPPADTVGGSPWSALGKLTFGPNNKPWKDGASIIEASGILYAVKSADKANLFYAYDWGTSTWIQKEDIPIDDSSYHKYKAKLIVKDGAATATNGSLIYATKGGGTEVFWRYTPGTPGVWDRMERIPIEKENKKHAPKTGAAMAYVDGKVYMLVGNKQVDFWCNIPSTGKTNVNNQISKTIQNTNVQSLIPNPQLNFQVNPNPFTKLTTIRYNVPISGKVSIKLYNTSGRMIKTLVNDYQNAGSYSLEIRNSSLEIPSGVYFLRYSDKTNQKEIKLIVE